MPTVEIVLPRPHTEIQRQMIEYPGNIVAFCGRRFGKTDGYVQRVFYWMQKNPGLYWWIGLSWRSASMKRAWREVTTIARNILKVLGLKERNYINRASFEIRIPGLGEIWFRTADNPSSLAGEGIRGAVVDEFSLMQEIVWSEYLEATLLDYGGWVAFGGVPKGKNWAAYLWINAIDRDGWIQIHATSYDNPFIDKSAIDEIRANRSEMLFRQEYLAEIVSDAGGVFRHVMDAATAIPEFEPSAAGEYIIGVDWGKHHDFTVLTVINATTRSVVHLDRFNQIDYTIQVNRLVALYERFKPSAIIAERNSMGDPLIEQLQRRGLPVFPFITTNATKARAIDELGLSFERGDIEIINDPVLIGELQAYEMERLPSGMMRYNAPSGMHDDCVMSLAIGWQGVLEWAEPEQDSIIVDDYQVAISQY